jgi:hypothetical protein
MSLQFPHIVQLLLHDTDIISIALCPNTTLVGVLQPNVLQIYDIGLLPPTILSSFDFTHSVDFIE